MENFSLSDIAAATNGGGFGGFGGEGIWIFALLVLMFGFNGGGWGNNSALTQGDLQRAVDLNSIQNGQRDIAADIQRTAYENMATTKDASYNNLAESRDIEATVNAGFNNMQNCCCEIKQGIMENRYLNAQNTASINANTTAAMQKVLDTIQQEKIASLQSEVSDLKTASMFCGIPRINPYGYNVVPSYPPAPMFNNI